MGGVTNNVSQAQDLDGMVDYLIYKVVGDAEMMAAGYHNY